MKRIVAVSVLFGLASSVFAAGEQLIQLSGGTYYVTGNAYEQMAAGTRSTYVMGVMDGLLGSWTLDGVAPKHVGALGACLQGIPSGQARAVVDKFMADNPSRWDSQMNALVYNALNEMCRTRGTPIWP